MGHGSSIPSSQSKKGVVSVQALRAGLRFKAGIGHHDKESTTSQGEGSKEEHDEREQREKKRLLLIFRMLCHNNFCMVSRFA